MKITYEFTPKEIPELARELFKLIKEIQNGIFSFDIGEVSGQDSEDSADTECESCEHNRKNYPDSGS